MVEILLAESSNRHIQARHNPQPVGGVEPISDFGARLSIKNLPLGEMETLSGLTITWIVKALALGTDLNVPVAELIVQAAELIVQAAELIVCAADLIVRVADFKILVWRI